MRIKLTVRERATILASLRRWLSYPAAREADSIATSGGKYKPLDNAEIERLCKRLTKTERKHAAGPLLHQSTNGDRAGARIEQRTRRERPKEQDKRHGSNQRFIVH